MRPDRSSATARIIAAAVLLADRVPSITPRPEPGQVEWSERLLAADPAARGLLRCVGTRAGRGLLRFAERCLLPGIIRHYLCRKQWLAAAWNEAHREGFRQLLVLGPGYDALPLRWAAADDVHIVEIDHPATQRVRRAVVESAGFSRPPRLVSLDLASEPLGRSIEPVLDHGADLFALAEGVLMYLDGPRVESIVRELAASPCPASQAGIHLHGAPPRTSAGIPSAEPARSTVARGAPRAVPIGAGNGRPEELAGIAGLGPQGLLGASRPFRRIHRVARRERRRGGPSRLRAGQHG